MIAVTEKDVQIAMETVNWGKNVEMTYEGIVLETPEQKVFSLTFKNKKTYQRYHLFIYKEFMGLPDSLEMHTYIKTADKHINVNRTKNTTKTTDLLLGALSDQIKENYGINAYPDLYEERRIMKFLAPEESKCYSLISEKQSRRLAFIGENNIKDLKSYFELRNHKTM